MIRQETAVIQERIDSLATRFDQLQQNVSAQAAEDVEQQDQAIDHQLTFRSSSTTVIVMDFTTHAHPLRGGSRHVRT